MLGFQKSITLGVRNSGSVNLFGLKKKIAKNLQKICKICAPELGSKMGGKGGFQKILHCKCWYSGFAKKVAKNCKIIASE